MSTCTLKRFLLEQQTCEMVFDIKLFMIFNKISQRKKTDTFQVFYLLFRNILLMFIYELVNFAKFQNEIEEFY